MGTNNDIAVVWFCNKPVNIFSIQLFKQSAEALSKLKANPKCKGIIMLSKYGAKRNIFSAGFDLSLFAKVCSIQYLLFLLLRKLNIAID